MSKRRRRDFGGGRSASGFFESSQAKVQIEDQLHYDEEALMETKHMRRVC